MEYIYINIYENDEILMEDSWVILIDSLWCHGIHGISPLGKSQRGIMNIMEVYMAHVVDIAFSKVQMIYRYMIYGWFRYVEVLERGEPKQNWWWVGRGQSDLTMTIRVQ